ncbi:hypothetical protein HYT84_00425 [Candidatus Micrarchaeota archaeon]|nr:hypothetical protein [Candidatus Micrarchaeota archaeon]
MKFIKGADRELGRQLIHAIVAVILIGLLFSLDRYKFMVLLFFGILFGSLIINWKSLGSRVPIADWFHYRFERPDARFPGYGSAWYAIGVLLMAVFLADVSKIAAGIVVLGIGDAVSTIIGLLYGKNKLFYNPKKSVEGTLAFFAASLVSYLFIGPLSLVLAAISALVESLPVPLDDNLTIPLIATAILYLI